MRLPAEWEAAEYVLLSWPHKDTDWAYMLPQVEECYVELARAIAKRTQLVIVCPDTSVVEPKLRDIPESNRPVLIQVPTNDTWIRDFGTISTVDDNNVRLFNDFKFNGWGLKFAADKDNLVTCRVFGGMNLFKGEYRNRLNFVLEGGAIESDGRGTLITTRHCQLSPNRNGAYDISQIETNLKDFFGLDRVLWLSHGALEGDDTDGHIDTLVRIAPPGDVLFYVGCQPDDCHYAELSAMKTELERLKTADGNSYHLVELPLPDPIYDEDDGHRLPATYANFLILNGAVLLPVYGQPLKDKMAADLIKTAMPDYEVVPIDCRALIRQHGSLHCATMQIPFGKRNSKAD